MKLGIFISGTDTGVGKTVVSSLLTSSLKSFGIRSGYFKPVQTGSDLDSQTVSQLTGIPVSNFPQPVYQFSLPQSPNRAAMAEGKQIHLKMIRDSWEKLDERSWVVEGAGGLLVPLNSHQTNRDLIMELGLRLLLVASTRLGTINHTLLTIEAAQRASIPVMGIVLTGEEDPGLEQVLFQHSRVPVITRVPRFLSLSSSVIRENGVNHFPIPVLRMLYE
jgi:dethiobiotin synthase